MHLVLQVCEQNVSICLYLSGEKNNEKTPKQGAEHTRNASATGCSLQ